MPLVYKGCSTIPKELVKTTSFITSTVSTISHQLLLLYIAENIIQLSYYLFILTLKPRVIITMSAPQAPRKLTIVDMVYLQGLKKELAELKQKKPQPEGLAEKVKNFEACISYIASHGVTTQDSYLLYANGGKAIVEKADNFLTKTAPKGTLYNARANLCIVVSPSRGSHAATC
jgi:hypothetical protein